MEAITVTPSPGWSIFKAKGDLLRDDIIVAITTHLPQLVAPHIIWDLRDASMNRMTRADFAAVAEAAKSLNLKRGPAKTAFVGSSQDTLAVTFMYTGLASLAELPIEYAAFETMAEAERWVSEIQQATA